MATWQGRKGGYHQEDGKHATAGKEKKWQQALLISAALKTTLHSRPSNRVGVKQRASSDSDDAKRGHFGGWRRNWDSRSTILPHVMQCYI